MRAELGAAYAVKGVIGTAGARPIRAGGSMTGLTAVISPSQGGTLYRASDYNS